MCVPLSRRQLLRYSALAAATPLVRTAWRPAGAFEAAAAAAVPMHLELVTLTERSAIFTWFTGDPTSLDQFGRPAPIPSDTTFFLGTAPDRLERVHHHRHETPYHYVELTHLRPGRRYFYRAASNGIDAVPTTAAAGQGAPLSFVTPPAPRGRHVFTMAWLNDLHIGEAVSGLATTLPNGQGFPPGFPVDPANPYWEVMTKAAVAEAKERGAELMLVNGDLTSDARPHQLELAKSWLDDFGDYGSDYHVVRGNHDRAHSGSAYAACTPAAGAPGYNDCLRDYFFPDGAPTYYSFAHRGVHFVALDTNDLTTGNGAITPEQFAWLEADLAAHAGTPTFVFGHHPVSEESAATAIPPVVFTLNPRDAARLEGDVNADPSVVGVYSGHTHRNKRTFSPRAPKVPFMEMGAVKEYPGGYTLVRVFTDGYAVNFYKCRTPAALTWSERSRGEYLNLYPYYTLGGLGDRNFFVPADLCDAG